MAAYKAASNPWPARLRIPVNDLTLGLLTAIIYGLDLTLPAGEAMIILLILVIILAGRAQNYTRLAVWSGICITLTIGGYFLRHGLTYNPTYTARRAICLFAFLAAVAVLLRNHSLTRMRTQRDLLLQEAAAAIFTRSAEGNILSWSKGAEMLYGFTPSTALGRNSHELFKEEDADLLAASNAALATVGRWRGELRRHKADGSPLVILCDCARHTIKRGEPAVILESGTDVTPFRAVKEQLQRSEAHIRGIFEMAAAAIWEEDFLPLTPIAKSEQMAHAQKAVTYHLSQVRLGGYNQEAMALLNGGAAPPMTGTLLRHCQSSFLIAYLAAALSGRASFRAETSFIHPASGQKHILVSVRFLPQEGGLNRALISAIDITQQKKTEDELAALTEQLNQVTRNTALGELAELVRSRVEHPLAAIAEHSAAASALLLNSTIADAQLSALLRQIIQEAKAASSSIATIREFLRRSQFEQHSKPFNDILQHAVSLLDRDFAVHNLALRLMLPPALPELPKAGFWLEHTILYILLMFLQDAAKIDSPNKVLWLYATCLPGQLILEFLSGSQSKTKGEKQEAGIHWGEGFCLCRNAVMAHGGDIHSWVEDGRLTSLQLRLPIQPLPSA